MSGAWVGWSYLLTAVGITGLVLSGSKRTVGWAVGLAAQVLWVAYALATRQYGFILSAAAYGAVYARNWWRWRQDERRGERPTSGEVPSYVRPIPPLRGGRDQPPEPYRNGERAARYGMFGAAQLRWPEDDVNPPAPYDQDREN